MRTPDNGSLTQAWPVRVAATQSGTTASPPPERHRETPHQRCFGMDQLLQNSTQRAESRL